MLKIRVFVDDSNSYTFLESEGLIEAFSMDKGMGAEISAPVSPVTAGEVNLQFSNLFSEFNITNTDSVYSNLKNGQKIIISNFISEEEEKDLFTGYIVDFDAPTSSQTQSCMMRAVDPLQRVLSTPVVTSDLQVERDLTIPTYLGILFAACGLGETGFEIDGALSERVLDFSLLSGSTVGDQLNEICVAGDCYIYCDGTGVVKVVSKEIKGESEYTFSRTDNDYYLTSSTYGLSLAASYKSLKIAYKAPKLSEVKLLYSGNIICPEGEFTLNPVLFETSNVYEIDSIKLKLPSDSNVRITSFSATPSSITLSVNNPSTELEVPIEVFGKVVETADTFAVRDLGAEEVDQTLEIASILLQKQSDAEWVAERVYKRAMKKVPFITATVEVSDFPVTLGTVVTVNDSDVSLLYTGYVYSIDLDYDGGGYAFYTLGIKALDDNEEEEVVSDEL